MAHPFIKRRFRIPTREIGYLRFLLEGYDGLAFLRTLDSRTGLVEIAYALSRSAEAEELIAALSSELPLVGEDLRAE